MALAVVWAVSNIILAVVRAASLVTLAVVWVVSLVILFRKENIGGALGCLPDDIGGGLD